MKTSRAAFLLLLIFFAFRSLSFAQTKIDSAVRADSILSGWLTKRAVNHQQYVQKNLYSWTSAGQVESLRKGGPLLRKSVSDSGDVSVYDQQLFNKKYDRNPLAVLLRGSDRRNKRFAWSNPWATALGYQEENYGDRLIRITISDSAIFCCFMPGSKTPFTFCDMNGKTILPEDAIRHADRIAVVYHVEQTVKRQYKYTYRPRMHSTFSRPHKSFFRHKKISAFREYVIVNESMITQWEIGAPGVKNDLFRDVQNLSHLLKYREQPEHRNSYHLQVIDKNFSPWSGKEISSGIETLYCSTLCFSDDPKYIATQENLDNIIRTLQQRWKMQGEPLMRFNTGN